MTFTGAVRCVWCKTWPDWIGFQREQKLVDEGEKEGMEIYFEGLTVKGSREMG